MIEKITSLQNQRIKKAIRLHASRGRQLQKRIIVFGNREVSRAIESGVQFEEIFCTEELWDKLLPMERSHVSNSAAQLFFVVPEVFEKLAYGSRTGNLIGIAARPATSFDSLAAHLSFQGELSIVLVLQSIEKPGNLGAIVRTADACGIDAIICADPLTDFFHPNVIRSSTGVVFQMPLVSGTTPEIQDWLEQQEFKVFTAMLENASNFYQADLTGKVALVLGNEAKGLGKNWTAEQYLPVKLPMQGQADSLNVSVTGSVMMYEAMRQRT
ncbi:MAG: TrmH family RNA methyltransferase [Pirellulales bacterium]